MLGEGTLTRLIKFYNPVAVGKDLGGIRERERGREEKRKGGRQRKREERKTNQCAFGQSITKRTEPLTFSFCLCCVRSNSVTFSSWNRKFN